MIFSMTPRPHYPCDPRVPIERLRAQERALSPMRVFVIRHLITKHQREAALHALELLGSRWREPLFEGDR